MALVLLSGCGGKSVTPIPHADDARDAGDPTTSGDAPGACTWQWEERKPVTDDRVQAVFEFALDIAPSGEVIVAYDGYSDVQAMWTTTSQGGAWSSPVDVGATSSVLGFHQRIVAPGDARAVLAWQALDDAFQPRYIEASYRSSSGGWSSPARVATDVESGSHSLVGLTDGGAALTWCDSDFTISVAQLDPKGAWSTPHVVGTAGPTSYPVIAAENSGNLVVAWGVESPPERAVATRFDVTTGSWSAPVELGPLDANRVEPTVAFAGRGEPLVAWADLDEVYFARWKLATEAWETTSIGQVPAGTPRARVEGIRLLANDRGDAVVAWTIVRPETEKANGEPWIALFQNERWRSPERLAGDTLNVNDVALTRDGDVILTLWGWNPGTTTTRTEVQRYDRRADTWSPRVTLDDEVGAALVVVDAEGTATVVWGLPGWGIPGDRLWSARQSCR